MFPRPWFAHGDCRSLATGQASLQDPSTLFSLITLPDLPFLFSAAQLISLPVCLPPHHYRLGILDVCCICPRVVRLSCRLSNLGPFSASSLASAVHSFSTAREPISAPRLFHRRGVACRGVAWFSPDRPYLRVSFEFRNIQELNYQLFASPRPTDSRLITRLLDRDQDAFTISSYLHARRGRVP